MLHLPPILTVLLACSLGGLLYARRRGPRGRAWLEFGGFTALFLWCWPPAAWLFAATLEHRYAVSRFPAGEAEAIVVLSGNAYPANPSQPEAEPGLDTYLRVAHAAWLYHHWKALPVLVSGGPTRGPENPTMAALMCRQLLAEGVPESMIWVENQSLTTYENAVGSARLLHGKGLRRVALVTEGFHMLRGDLCFRKQGIEVTPAPCAYRTLEPERTPKFLLPDLWAIRVNGEAFHEWVGLAWYKLRGRL